MVWLHRPVFIICGIIIYNRANVKIEIIINLLITYGDWIDRAGEKPSGQVLQHFSRVGHCKFSARMPIALCMQ